MNLLDIVSQYVVMKKSGAASYAGPCPFCNDGKDRFIVWPAGGKNGTGTYYCRICGNKGDVIQFIRDKEGKSYKDACMAVGQEPVKYKRKKDVFIPAADRDSFSPFSAESGLQTPAMPNEQWMEKADKLVEFSNQYLLDNMPDIMQWLDNRGIDDDAVRAYRIGWFPGEKEKNAAFRPRKAWGLPEEKKYNGKPRSLWIPRGLVVPFLQNDRTIKIKIRRPSKDRTPEFDLKYYLLPGSYKGPSIHNHDAQVFVVVEAELDAICVAAHAGDLVGAIGIGTSRCKQYDAISERLRSCLRVLVALDFDAAGSTGFSDWGAEYPAIRWPVPQGKDPGEAHAAGVNIRQWVVAGLPPALTVGRSPGELMERGGVGTIEGSRGGGVDKEGCSKSEYDLLFEKLCELSDWIHNPEAAPETERRAKVPEAMAIMKRLEQLEQRGSTC